MSQRWFQLQTHFRQASALTGRKFFLLFLFLLGSLILYPFAQHSAFGYYAFRVLGSVAIVLSVYAVSFRRSLVIIALLLAIPTVLQRVLPTRAGASLFSILNIVLSFVFDAFIVVVIFRRVFARDQPNSETIFGVLCIYRWLDSVLPASTGCWPRSSPTPFISIRGSTFTPFPDRFDFIYYRFGTITALGAAGIMAVSARHVRLRLLKPSSASCTWQS